MFKEIDVIVLLEDVSEGEAEAKAGAMGTVVHTYDWTDNFMVEFTYGDVYRCDLIHVKPHQARLATEEDIRIERERRERARSAQPVAD